MNIIISEKQVDIKVLEVLAERNNIPLSTQIEILRVDSDIKSALKGYEKELDYWGVDNSSLETIGEIERLLKLNLKRIDKAIQIKSHNVREMLTKKFKQFITDYVYINRNFNCNDYRPKKYAVNYLNGKRLFLYDNYFKQLKYYENIAEYSKFNNELKIRN